MVTNLWGLIYNFKQRKRSSGKLEYLLLTVDSHGEIVAEYRLLRAAIVHSLLVQ